MADAQHHALRIVAPGTSTPLFQLLGQIGGGLTAKRRVGRAGTFALRTVAVGTGGKAPGRVTAMIKRDRFDGADGPCSVRSGGPRGVVS
ncbi:hypothetical protein BFL28_02825 [Sphingomonas turrisvirgatae]|uniref:Uncharacterized protein n=1 Tax=Sphingomonas turrisvirgatae TaxID=1888892 RepID=A0A1E3LWK9_9SPHN|nr:hypothetical protein [Sphingomonas turrisvirgatae]ODP37180.1 hypothetical protein BFL28_02825 [Sphingomonas turrisvirgatae]